MKNKKIGYCGLIVIGIPIIFLAVHVLLIQIPLYMRHPINVHFTVVDRNGTPIRDAELISHEAGWRGYFPIPFSPAWLVKFPSHTNRTDAAGRAVITYKQDYLELNAVVVADHPVRTFSATLHRFDGQDFPQPNKVTEMYGFYDKAPDPYRRDYTIAIDQ